jgi:ribonucleoside-diphosphate reductase alpha chain
MAAWKAGCKGVTVYRDGCRDQVIRKAKDTPVAQVEDQELITESTAPKRPKELPCHIVQANVKGEKWTILVGLLDGRPYEVMGGLSKYVEIPRKHKTGKLVKNGKRDGVSTYNLHFGEGEDAGIVKDIVNTFENANFGAFTRLLSTSLRHGTPVQFIVEQLGKDKDSDMFSFSRVIARVLKSHIADGTKVTSEKECPSCHQDALRYQEGCVTCTSCGFSKCS